MRAFLVGGIGLLMVGTTTSLAGEVGYVEDFALAEDREASLRLLIPGSEEYYFYHCLHYQNTQQFDKVEELLAAWIKRYNYTPGVREIQNRQALLTYDRSPDRSLEFLRNRLGLRFDHTRETIGEKPNLPTELDAGLITRERLAQRARQQHKDLSGFEQSALSWLVEEELDPDRRRHLLQRLERPDHEGLAKLIVDDLNYRNSQPFGSMTIHGQLLLSQLDECLRLKPDLLNQQNFVNMYLSKLRPNDDVDWQFETEEHRAYLGRLWNFVSQLDPVHNSLKAHVLYHRLVFDRARGIYDKQRFMTYIALPRQVAYIQPKFLELNQNRRFAADLQADFEPLTLLPPIRNDEPLVASYLHHFFLSETTTDPYEPYLSDAFLRRHLAEAKIVNGLGEAEQWYSLLPPDQYQALKDRIDLDFAPTNQTFFATQEPVSLDVLVKNVRSLIVRVFRINTRNYFREHRREVNTDINLDGLIANDEQTFEYTEPPLRRVRRHFEFPALSQPGVYVVDFIGNGMNSRAVIRKGQLRHLVRNAPQGHIFTVINESNQRVDDASIWLDGHEYHANDRGEILVPYSTNPGRHAIIISRGELSSLAFFEHQAETHELKAGIYVDRESLLARRRASVVVRPGLRISGTPVTLSVLEDVRLTITSVDQDGVSSSQEIQDFKLFEDRESSHEFLVPPRLAQISFLLRAKVQNHSRNEKVTLQSARSFELNGIDQTDNIEDLHFARINGQVVLELLGKSGEPKPDRPVQLSIKHRDFTEPVSTTLQTNESGRVMLGELKEIASVMATGPDGLSRTWSPVADQHSYTASLHGVAGQSLAVPYMGQETEPRRNEVSLLELRGNTFTVDRFDRLSISDGMLQLKELPRGDYDLLLKESGQRIRIRMADGPLVDRFVLGKARELETRRIEPLQIAMLAGDDQQLSVRLVNSSPMARVHVFGTRYRPPYSAFANLAVVRAAEPYVVGRGHLASLYVAGRSIGDEYQYIINRRYAQKFPGVMLERPSVLLNPWAVRDTTAGQQEAQAGSDFAATPEAAPPAAMRPESSAAKGMVSEQLGNLDFLAEASAVLINLEPDEDGKIQIPLDALGGHQQLHVVAIDPLTTVYRSVSLPERSQRTKDLRLLAGLDPKRHFTQQRQISVLGPNEELVLPDITTSRYETYDTLARVYALYATLTNDSKLAEFGFVMNWPNLSSEERRRLYSEHACHELNFFLAMKDPEFFESVVQPYLANKKDKTFLDHWLLSDDLSEYLRPWNYGRLNVVERILLSRRIASDRPHTRRDIRDQWDLLPPDLERQSLLFLTAVKGQSLDADKVELFARQIAAEEEALKLGVVELRPGSGRLGRGLARDMLAAPSSSAEGHTLELGLQDLSDNRDRAEETAGRPGSLRRKLSESEQANGNFGYFFDVQAGESLRRLYQKLDQTKEWAENNYYKLPIEEQNSQLVTVDSFWLDYAEHDPSRPFRSPHFAEASGQFTEMMMALAVLDLPFQADQPKTEFAESKLTLSSAGPMIVFHEEIREAGSIVEQTPILVSQNFFRHGDRYRYEGSERLDKFVTDEFLVHAVYGCQVVITNPTSSPQKLDVLLQIPVGAIPVLNAHQTQGVKLDLQPYNTQTLEYHFYFPLAGTYPHYPVHVSKNEKLLAHAEPIELTVVEQLSRIDRDSWPYVSQNGSAEDVLNYLRDRNLHRTDLEKIAFRMGNKDFFLQVVELLSQRHAYNHTLWSYGIKHDYVPAIRQYLRHSDEFVQACGAYIQSPLVTINPVARHTYQHLDYRPLVNARAHQLGRRRQIVNDRLNAQYHQLLTILSYRRDLTAEDRLAVTYYLLLQDRVGESIATFDQINASDLATQMQYDYSAAYLHMYREDVSTARQIAERYLEHPVDQWRTAFASLDRQLDEIDSGQVEVLDPRQRGQTQTQLAATAPAMELRVEARKLHLAYQNVERVRVNYYLMDIELLFSRNPFVQEYSNQFSQIHPNFTETHELPDGRRELTIEMPRELHNRNVLVEVAGGGVTKSQAYFSNSLAVQVSENYGQLRVTAASDEAKPSESLSKVYVKAYARMRDGTVQFYKDGYTDLRGRFDYSSLNTNELDQVDKFALLVLSEEHGAVVREAMPPRR